MDVKPIILDVDFKRNTIMKEHKVRHGDNIPLMLRVFDDGEAFDLSDMKTISLVITRLDRQTIVLLGKVHENQATFNLGGKELAVSGSVQATAQFYSVDGRVSTFNFKIIAEADPITNYIPLKEEETLIVQVLKNGPTIIEAAQTATVGALQAEEIALSAAEATNQSRENLSAAVIGTLDNLEKDKAKALLEMAEEKTLTKQVKEDTLAVKNEVMDLAKTVGENGDYAKTEGDRAKKEADRLEGTDVSVLDNKITSINNNLTTQLADTAKQQQTTPMLQPYDSRIEVYRTVMAHDSGDKIYAVYSRTGATYDLETSTDNGVTWERKGTLPALIRTLTKIHKTGTLLAVEQKQTTVLSTPRMWRSTDDGATWSEVSIGLNYPPLGTQGITETPSGAICIGEYGNVANTGYRILRSTDDGLTWNTVYTAPGTDPAGDPGHIHSVTYDPYENKLIAFVDRPATGKDGPYIIASSNEGLTWDILGVVTTNTRPNFVSPMYFETHIAWGSDNERNGVVSRIKRTDFYSGNFDSVEDVAFLNKKVFYYTFPIRQGVWVLSMANETVASATVPEGPGSFANEVLIVSDNGKVVSGGITHYQSTAVPGKLSANKIDFPSYKFDRLDHKGLSWMNIVIGSPRPYAAIPYSQGVGLPSTPIKGMLSETTVLPNMYPLLGKKVDGSNLGMLSIDDGDRIIVRHGTSTANTAARFHPDGEFDILKSNVRRLYTQGDQIVIPKLAIASNGLGFYASSGDPNGNIAASVGSICLNWNFNKGIGLWVKETGSGNTGWVPIGAIGGSTTSRPTTRYLGMSYFDSTLGKPIWWNGTTWVDSSGATV